MAVRSAMHHAGATALCELLQFEAPVAEQLSIPCGCGHQAHYQELRSKPVLTAVGRVEVSPIICARSVTAGNSPQIANWTSKTRSFPLVSAACWPRSAQEAPFDHGRQQMKLLADLQVTTKSVERTAEAIGADIAACAQQEIERALQLDLPMVVGDPIPILYVLMDGTGCLW